MQTTTTSRVSPLFEAAHLTAEAIPHIAWVTRPDGVTELLNRKCLDYLGLGPADVPGWDWRSAVHPDDQPRVAALWDRARAVGGEFHAEYRLRRHDGAYRWHLGRSGPVLGADGAVLRWVGTGTDIDDRVRAVEERERAEAETRAWNARYEAVVKAAGQVLYDWDTATGRLWWGGSCEPTLGYAPGELPADLAGWTALVHPDDRAGVAAEAARVAATGEPFRREYRLRRKDGTYATVSDHGNFLSRPGERPGRMVGLLADVTDRRRLEQALLQAQKLEAVGRLAGGVAHDFNNLLTAINGFADMALAALPDGHPAAPMVGEVLKAGERAAGVTRQLLAFGRRQILRHRVFDLNEVVADLAAMLRRVIGEDVRLALDPGPGPLRVRADPGQVGQVVMNLAVNARDAMPTGGRLAVGTRAVALAGGPAADGSEVLPGEYALLAVSDTGAGIPPDVLPHVFEPFFTTKGPGQGTGLGLATVYGIVKQSGGHVEVESEPGQGTTVRVYLPAAGGAPGPAGRGAGGGPLPRGRETVLVVEDEDGVRELARHTLDGLGYTVLAAADLAGAEAAAGAGGRVDLLLTDVVMPGAGGREVADRLRRSDPGLRVVFTSGHTDDAVVRHGVEQDRVAFLPKPFTPADLARKVREALDAEGG